MDNHSLNSDSSIGTNNFVIDIKSQGVLFQVRGKLIKEEKKTQDKKGVFGKLKHLFSKGVKGGSETKDLVRPEKEILKIGDKIFEISKTALQNGRIVKLKLDILEQPEYSVSNTSYDTFKREIQKAKKREKQPAKKDAKASTDDTNTNNNANVNQDRSVRIVAQTLRRSRLSQRNNPTGSPMGTGLPLTVRGGPLNVRPPTAEESPADANNNSNLIPELTPQYPFGQIPGVDYNLLTPAKLKRIKKFIEEDEQIDKPPPSWESLESPPESLTEEDQDLFDELGDSPTD